MNMIRVVRNSAETITRQLTTMTPQERAAAARSVLEFHEMSILNRKDRLKLVEAWRAAEKTFEAAASEAAVVAQALEREPKREPRVSGLGS
jgi:hypothetical protein